MSKKLVEFGPDQAAALARLSAELGQTQTGLVRAGLALIQIAVREAKRGGTIAIVRDDHTVVQLAGVWSEVEMKQAGAA